MKVCVIGTGYVGLVAGACFADVGNHVICVDISEEKIDALQRGQIPIYEPGLEDIVRRHSAAGRLTFSTDVPQGIKESEIIIIAVGTTRGEEGSADLQYVESVARTIADTMNGCRLVVDKCTMP